MEKLSIKFNYLSSLSLQETCDIEEAVQNKGQTEPYVLLVGSYMEPTQAFLIIDNICYTRGCANVYAFLEHSLFNIPHKKLPPSVDHFLATLHVHL